jgi:dihydroxyacetone kinase-like predicted kinase
VDGVQVKAGDFIGLMDDKVILAGPDLEPVIEDMVARLLEGGRSLLTALIGDEENAEEATAVLDKLRDIYSLVDFDLHEGGQPFYPVLLSAE